MKKLEYDILKVFYNNIMPANAAAWYMAKVKQIILFFTELQHWVCVCVIWCKFYFVLQITNVLVAFYYRFSSANWRYV